MMMPSMARSAGDAPRSRNVTSDCRIADSVAIGVLALEGMSARGHFVEHDSEAEHVGPLIDGLASRLFRRHVRDVPTIVRGPDM